MCAAIQSEFKIFKHGRWSTIAESRETAETISEIGLAHNIERQAWGDEMANIIHCNVDTESPKSLNSKSQIVSLTGNVILLSISSGLSVLASVGFGMIAARYLSKQDFATIRQTFLAYEFVAPLLALGLPSALYYLLPQEKAFKKGVVLDNIALLFIAALIFGLFIVCGGTKLLALRFNNPHLEKTLPWLALYPLFVMPAAGLPAVLVTYGKTKLLGVYNVITNGLLVGAGILAVVLTRSYELPIIARVAIPGLLLPLAIVTMYRAVPGPVRAPRWQTMGRMLAYSIPLGMANMLGTITLQLHGIVVASMCSSEDFAVYINGATEIPLIGVVTGSITSVITAEMARLYSRGDKVGALELFKKASIKTSCILLPSMILLIATAESVVSTLYTDQYIESVVPFILLQLVIPVRIVMYGAVFMALGLSRIVLIRSAIDLGVNGILCFILVQRFGYFGAIIATLMTLYFWSIPYNLFKMAEAFDISCKTVLPFQTLGKIMLASCVCAPLAVLGASAHFLNHIARILLSAALYFPVVIYVLYRMKYLSISSNFLMRMGLRVRQK